MEPAGRNYNSVVIGCSAGGVRALALLLAELPSDFAMSVIVVQHIGDDHEEFFAYYLNGRCRMSVLVAEDKMALEQGHIYIAPSGYHLLVEDDKTLALSIDRHVNYSRPAIDVLFSSAAEVFKKRLIGVVLTGANSDGSHGLRYIKELGGLTVVQDPIEAEVDYMPMAAIEATQVDYVLTLSKIRTLLINLHEEVSNS